MTPLRTPARMALLRAVADGHVREEYPPGGVPVVVWDHGPNRADRLQPVTLNAMRTLHRAGWVLLGDRIRDEPGAPRLFLASTAGRTVLEQERA